jgi:hypothetical protein
MANTSGFDWRSALLGGSSITDIVTSLQLLVQAANAVTDALNGQIPHFTSGTMSASKVINIGVTRVTGYSITAETGASAGNLYDAVSIAAAGPSNLVDVMPGSVGYFPRQIFCQNGCVFIPGTGDVATVYFSKT